jgi:YVTN family beta-propeller protein
MHVPNSLRRVLLAAAIAASCALPAASAFAQSVGATIPVGTNPLGIAVNPVSNKLYVANAGSDNVTVIDLTSGGSATIPSGDFTRWLGINTETNRIYASALLGANVTVINGATDTVATTLGTGGAGWTAVNPLNDRAYVLRYGAGDEVNVLQGQTYLLTSATKSYQPVSLAINPVNNWIYIAHQTTGDIVSMDMTTPAPYPPMKCPDGAGGLLPQPGDEEDPYANCINVPDFPLSVALNPLTNKIYSLSTNNQITVINGAGNNHIVTSVTPTDAAGARVIAVNPVNNRIYAAYANAVVVMDGVTNATTTIPAGSVGGGPVAIGINPLSGRVYVPSADGSLLIIYPNGTTDSAAIPVDARAIAVNPLSHTVYILHPLGVTPVVDEAPTSSTGITATITPLADNTGGSSGSITINASSSMSPAPLDTIRRVYYRFGTTGAWTQATGTGPYTASYSGFEDGSYVLQVFATNGLEAPNANTDLANVPITSTVVTYNFSVDTSVPPPAKKIQDFNNDGKSDLTWKNAGSTHGIWLMDGNNTPTVASYARPAGTVLHRTGDFDGDGDSDLLWRTAAGGYEVSIMNGTTIESTTTLLGGGTGWENVAKGDFDGNGKEDLIWRRTSDGLHGMWLMNGGAIASAHALASPGATYTLLKVGDFSGDGKADLLWRATDGTVVIQIMSGATVSSSGTTAVSTAWTFLDIGDFNADGKTDTLWRHTSNLHGVWLMDGATISSAVATFGPTGAQIHLVGDFDGNGRSDLLWRGANGSYHLTLLSGNAVVGPSNEIYVGGGGWEVDDKGDYDGDAKDDLLWRNTNGSYGTWLVDGTTIKSYKVILPPGTGWEVYP